MSAIYLYAIMPNSSSSNVIWAMTGIDPAHPKVYTIEKQNIAALVSDTEQHHFQGLTQEEVLSRLVVHQQVIEGAMQHTPLLPVQFGTTFNHKNDIERLLQQHALPFEQQLNKFQSLVQLEVVALWDPQTVLQSIAQMPEIVAHKTSLSQQSIITEADQIALGQQVKRLFDERRTQIGHTILSKVREFAVDTINNPCQDDMMIVNLALLLERTSLSAVEDCIDALDLHFDSELSFRLIGPLPAHSFATLYVDQPIYQEIDAARQCLGLSEAVSQHQIKQTYHHLATQAHPDRQVQGTSLDLLTPMEEINGAYQLLEQYAAAQPIVANSDDELVHFDQDHVDQTIFATFQRMVG
ncbi:MAG: GvpL/GvpF family gas vesicle protein [Chloroflexota bacterium]